MAPSYKLIYFNAKGAAEAIRFLLKYGNLEFEDVRIEKEDWPQKKSSFPFGQLPCLECNGKKINQSVAICRYVANEVKLAGRNNLENLEIDAIVDTITDFKLKISPIWYEQDEKVKAEKTKVALTETVPFYLEKLDKIAKENNGHLALGKLTWADIYLVAGESGLNYLLKKDVLADYPNLVKVRNNVVSVPAIKNWIATRPKTDY